MARKRKKKGTTLDDVLAMLSRVARPEIGGLGLILISVFTLVSLLTGSRGSVTGFWIDLLQTWTGVGVWGVPLLAAVLGLWMVIRVVERMPDLPWQRPVGLFLFFMAYITAVTLWIPAIVRADYAAEGQAGGRIGLALAGVLESTLGVWGAWSLVTFLGITGLILLTDRLLPDLAIEARDALLETYRQMQAREPGPGASPIRPQVPLPTGELPRWKRLFRGGLHRCVEWLAGVRGLQRPVDSWQDSTEMVLSEPPSHRDAGQSMPAESAQNVKEQEAANDTPDAPGGHPLPGTEPETEATLTPRIVGERQNWELPDLADMLDDWDRYVDSYDQIRERGKLIEKTLELFGVPARFKEVNIGPTVTQYLIEPGYVERTVRGEMKKTKVKVSKISSLSNDLALALAAPSVRIEAPVPGTNYVGVEVPNQESNVVGLKELMESEQYVKVNRDGKLAIALGEDVKGKPVVTDMARMPHLLIAGATGAGKSVCINSIITCLLLTHTPETLRLLMVDPKMVELTVYNGAPHLLSPVVTEVDQAAGVLFWAVKEMERRYQLLSKGNSRDLERYNEYLRQKGEQTLPYIVVVIDEMADLMMAAPEEVEKHVCRLAQMARAVGIHLIIATQRPSVDVITGLIKANFPARIAFAVTSQTDSRVILDVPGADRLLGRGDMLFMAPDASKLERLQGTFLSDEEINRIVRYWQGVRNLEEYSPPPVPDVTEAIESDFVPQKEGLNGGTVERSGGPEDSELIQPVFEQIEVMKTVEARDDLFDEAVRVVENAGRGSTTLLQRKLRVGYNRASRLVDQLEEAGILGPDQGGNQGRVVYLDTDEDEVGEEDVAADGSEGRNSEGRNTEGRNSEGRDLEETNVEDTRIEDTRVQVSSDRDTVARDSAATDSYRSADRYHSSDDTPNSEPLEPRVIGDDEPPQIWM